MSRKLRVALIVVGAVVLLPVLLETTYLVHLGFVSKKMDSQLTFMEREESIIFGLFHPTMIRNLKHAIEAYDKNNYTKAANLLQPLTEKGYGPAENMLGAMYNDGKGVPKDDHLAFHWTMQAAEQDVLNAETRLGNDYFYGVGIDQNYSEALKWVGKASDRNDPDAEFTLAILYKYGHAVQKDDRKALIYSRNRQIRVTLLRNCMSESICV